GDVLNPNTGVIAVDVDAAVDIGDVEVAGAAAGDDGSALRHGDLEVVADARAAVHAILVGADDVAVALLDDFQRSLLVGGVGVVLGESADRFSAAHPDRAAVVGAGDARVAAKA